MAKQTSRKLTPTQRRVQDALRVIVEWEREIMNAAGRPWKANRDEIFWALLSYIEDVGEEDLPPRWFELAKEALLLAPARGVMQRVNAKWDKAMLLGFARQREQRNAARNRGRQQSAERTGDWSKWKESADRLRKKNSHLSKTAIGKFIQEEIYKNEGRHVGLRTITNRI
jgi:hypothetical protein